MKQSMVFIPTVKEAPKDAEVNSHKLMIRSGLIKRNAAGVFTYLPLGYKVIKKIENIIREELDNVECSELLMPAMQPNDYWKESGRWDKYGKELFRFNDRKDREFCLGPTHEEVITAVVRDHIKSYKKLPIALYQIQTKFRDELRPRYALMRGREFIMKDLYTFHNDNESLDEWYNLIMDVYKKIFKRFDLDVKIVNSDTGQMGGNEAHEFMVMSEVGEDTILYCDKCDFGTNVEVAKVNINDKCPVCNKGSIKEAKGIEVGNIFKLGTKYSESMKLNILNKEGKNTPAIMGCYGLGISRTLMAIVEQFSTENEIVYPEELSPFDIHVIVLDTKKEEQMSKGIEIYTTLKKKGYDVLLDDTDERAGGKFANADLIGIPKKVFIGRGITEGNIEIKIGNNAKEIVSIEKISTYFK